MEIKDFPDCPYSFGAFVSNLDLMDEESDEGYLFHWRYMLPVNGPQRWKILSKSKKGFKNLSDCLADFKENEPNPIINYVYVTQRNINVPYYYGM